MAGWIVMVVAVVPIPISWPVAVVRLFGSSHPTGAVALRIVALGRNRRGYKGEDHKNQEQYATQFRVYHLFRGGYTYI